MCCDTEKVKKILRTCNSLVTPWEDVYIERIILKMLKKIKKKFTVFQWSCKSFTLKRLAPQVRKQLGH